MVRVVQLLCPLRHCIIAGVYDPAAISNKAVVADLVEVAKSKIINPWCGICGSHDLRWEDMPTKFKTVEDAQASLAHLQDANLETRKILDDLGLTHDKQKLN